MSLDFHTPFSYTETMPMTPKWTSRIRHPFRRFKSDYHGALTEFTRALTLIVDFEQLLENLAGKLQEIADIPKIIIMIRDVETQRFAIADHRGLADNEDPKSLIFHPEDKLVRWLTINESLLLISENRGVFDYLSVKERRILSKWDIQLIVPLIVMNRVNGMVLLGPKRRETPFTGEELDLLSTLLTQSALAFENALLYREQKQRLRKMFRADRLATIGQIAAGAAHEIRNPLTSIRSTIQYMRKKEGDQERSEMFQELLDEVDRIDEIIQGLLSFSKPMEPQKENLDLGQLIQQVLTLTASIARKNKVNVTYDPLDENIQINADPSQLKQVFLNIVLNAIQSITKGGELNISLDQVVGEKDRKKSFIRIRFQDTGCGISEEDQELIFDPFYTTKKEGTGLGLSISYGIIQQHHGEIEVESSQESQKSGTTVSVILPAGEIKSKSRTKKS